jgi:hypothetical protein
MKAGTSSKVEYRVCPKCKQKTLRKGSPTASGKMRWTCRSVANGYCHSTTNPDGKVPLNQTGEPQVASKNPQFRRALGGIKRFVITCAQNATPLHDGFWGALKAYCKHTGAELVVIPTRYKNPTSRWTESQQNAEFWNVPDDVLYNQRKKLNDNLVLLGDIKTIPTAVRPLSGFEGISHGESCIVGHPKLQLATIATPQAKLPKILTTTGACTVANYTDSKAGKKGEFHHTLGACVVELEGKLFHMRQINAVRDGSFIDVDTEYFPDGTWADAAPALALAMGDTHALFADPAVMEATFGEGGIADAFNVPMLIWHDLFDGYSINPHHKDDPFIRLAKMRAGFGNVRQEVEFTAEFLRKYSAGRKSYVVESNHNDFLNRWMRRHDWRTDPTNADFYLDTARLMADGARMTPVGATAPDPFTLWLKKLLPEDNIRVLNKDESFMVGNIECGFHGDDGPNGAKGTVLNLSQLGVRVMSGHGHSPAIEGGHTRLGTSTRLTAEYTNGPSSWLNTHGVIYANSKRTLVNIINGKWRHD